MKKTTIIISSLIILAGVIFYSCSKEDKQINKTQNVVNDFKQIINNVDITSFNKAIDVYFPENPYDSIGILHNIVLQKLNEQNLLLYNSNIKDVISSLEIIFNKTLNDNDYIGYVKQLKSEIIINEVDYNESFINSLNTLTIDEKEIVNNYFLTMFSTTDVGGIIAKSKAAEHFIINSNSFSNIEKERMLKTFAIFRHSSSFWADFNKLKLNKHLAKVLASAVDAISYYCAANCINVNCDDFQDGKDLHMYSGLMSSIYYVLFGGF